MYSSKLFRDNTQGTVDFFANYIYSQPALQPVYHWLSANVSSTPIPQPKINVLPNQRFFVNVDKSGKFHLIKQIAIYKLKGDGWVLYKVLPTEGTDATNANGFSMEKGYYAATLVDRFDREGMKSYFEV